MKKTRDSISSTLDSIVNSFKKIDDDFLEELEEAMIMSDMGAACSGQLIKSLRERAKEQKITDTSKVRQLLKSIITDEMDYKADTESFPKLLLIVGVNGAGKTTAIGKLAYRYRQAGKKVLLAAGDTFRAAAAEQLEEWGRRSGAPVIRQAEGADPSAVVFDAITAAKSRGTDVLICDTAGRLQTKKNLMEELKKMNRIAEREYADAYKETYLVLDATTGQNAVSQARIFKEAVNVDGIILTKMDGTAKGGIILSIKQELGLQVKYIGVGEGIEDLEPFNAKDFAESILG
ncbi:MAG: signal recognition particle-docking protein FtsY [Christensenellales bacterium]